MLSAAFSISPTSSSPVSKPCLSAPHFNTGNELHFHNGRFSSRVSSMHRIKNKQVTSVMNTGNAIQGHRIVYTVVALVPNTLVLLSSVKCFPRNINAFRTLPLPQILFLVYTSYIILLISDLLFDDSIYLLYDFL